MNSRRRSEAIGTQDGPDAVGGGLQRVAQALTHLQEALRLLKQEAEQKVQEAEQRMQEALRQQKQEAERKVQEAERRMKEALHLQREEVERRSQEALRLQEETLCEMDLKLQEKDDAIRSLQQRLQETHVRMTALEERTTAPDGSGEEGLQSLEGRVNEGEASLQSALQKYMPQIEALLRQLHEPKSSRATVVTASASARQEPATGRAVAGDEAEHPPSSSTSTDTNAELQGALTDEERRRVELRVQEVNLRSERARSSPSPLGEQLCEAAEVGSLSDVQHLIDSGADVNYTNRDCSTPLDNAVWKTHADVVSLLLQRGADVNAVDPLGCSALHLAAMRDRSGRCVELLVRAGADVNARNIDGQTPLHNAAYCFNVEAVRALLAAGARRDLKPWGGVWKGRTPFEINTSSIIQDLQRL